MSLKCIITMMYKWEHTWLVNIGNYYVELRRLLHSTDPSAAPSASDSEEEGLTNHTTHRKLRR